MKKFFATFSLIALVALTNAQTLNSQDGLYYNFDSTPFNGNVQEYFENGAVKANLTVVNGALNGQADFFYISGKKMETGGYRAGQKDGEWVQFAENGTKTGQAFYKAGKKDGVWMVWDENGKKRCQMVYSDGKKVDVWQLWDENEQLVSERVYPRD